MNDLSIFKLIAQHHIIHTKDKKQKSEIITLPIFNRWNPMFKRFMTKSDAQTINFLNYRFHIKIILKINSQHNNLQLLLYISF